MSKKDEALAEQPAQQQEFECPRCGHCCPTQRKPLTDREVELLDGMIEVQLDHARRCDSIGNRPMADKQKAWDMERVELLRKLKSPPQQQEQP